MFFVIDRCCQLGMGNLSIFFSRQEFKNKLLFFQFRKSPLMSLNYKKKLNFKSP